MMQMVSAIVTMKTGERKVFYGNTTREIYPQIETVWQETKQITVFPIEMKELRQGKERLQV